MKTSLSKSVILSSSLMLALTVLSSCGKSKDISPQAPTPTAEVTKAPPAAPTTTPPTGPTLRPAPTSTPPTLAPPRGRPQPLPSTGPELNPQGPETLPPLPPAPTTTLPPLAPAPIAQRPPGLASPEQQIQGSEVRAYQVNFDGQVAVKTGGSSGDLLFTSAGDDGLMEEFKSYNARVSVDQQMKNNSLAKAITNAKLSRSSGEIAVSITVDEFGNLKTYRLTASSEDSKMKLSLSRNGTTGEMPFEGGFLKCLDIDGGCQTAYAKIKFAGGYARIIFRNSAADLHFLLQEKITGNSAFSALAKYILNAVNSVATSEKIEGMNVSSFEIINGRSAMGALMTTEDRQMIGLNIPMVVSSNATDVNANVTKSTDLSKSFDLDNLAGSYGTGLSQNISAVKLVKNNGRGQFKLQLQMGNAASIWIVIARMQKETISLEEIRTFESTVRAF